MARSGGLAYAVTGVYPAWCAFPGCDQPAPLGDAGTDDAYSLCLGHDQLPFYEPAEFDRQWAHLDPERSTI
jgi:hypothetical protein